MIACFDTSALIKLLLAEDGSELADELWAHASSRIANRLVYPEARAAIAAAERAERIDARARRTAVGDLESACLALQLIGLDWDLARHAGEIAQRYSLRGYDAVHLATALAAADSDLVLVTWDRDVARAAVSAGRHVVPAVAG